MNFDLCPILGLFFISSCNRNSNHYEPPKLPLFPQRSNNFEQPKLPLFPQRSNNFEVAYQWSNINFTWTSSVIYDSAFFSRTYVPENNVLSAIKFYKNNVYVSLPRFRDGTPVTLATFPASVDGSVVTDPLLTPFPSWEMNVQQDCASFQNVQSFEIDTTGIMYVLDGNRDTNFTTCPPKIVLLDLNNNGQVVQSYTVPNEVSRLQGGSLNDIVIEESDGGYGYISENSAVDPGIVVFSRRQNRAWKARSSQFFPNPIYANFTVGSLQNTMWYPVDGIALSPVAQPGDRKVYFCPVSELNMYAVSTSILKNETLVNSAPWRGNIELIGKRPGQSDGMVMDNKGNLFMGSLPGHAIVQWNNRLPFASAKIIYQDTNIVLWPDAFGIDAKGNVYVTTNYIIRFITTSVQLIYDNTIKMRILRLQTGTKSYLYS